jgi:hypothetical protein
LNQTVHRHRPACEAARDRFAPAWTRHTEGVTTEPGQHDDAQDDSPERRREDDAARYPKHDDPDALRERAGLDSREREDGPAGPVTESP